MTPNRKVIQTACPLDCPDSCSLEATVVDGRVTKLDGSHTNPATAGYICSKVRSFPDLVYGAERLRFPMRRTGPKGQGSFERISWDEALDLAAEKMQQALDSAGDGARGERILPLSYGGSNGLLTQDNTDARLFRRLGASRLSRTVCAAATSAALTGLYGKMPGVAYGDYRKAELIVIWGANPSASGIHLIAPIQDARKKGAKLIVVDPRATPLAKQADLHLAVRPGTDLVLALAIIRWLFTHERADLDFLAKHTHGADELRRRAEAWTPEKAAKVCGLDVAQIESFARLYAEASPAVIRCGWGQERNRNGASATAAILALPAVGGKFGVRGGGYTASNSGAWRGFDKEAIIGQNPAGIETGTGTGTNTDTEAGGPLPRLVNMNRLGRVLLEGSPSVDFLFVYNANPLATLPRQDLVRRGLEREDLFTLVFDPVMTDTALYADLLLPATTFLEHEDLRPSYGVFALQTVNPVIAPVGEARPNAEVFEALIHRLGLECPDDIAAGSLLEAYLSQDFLSQEQRSSVEATGHTAPTFGAEPVQLRDIFPGTPDQKIHLTPEALDRANRNGKLYAYAPDPASEAWPLSLISPATRRTISSSLGSLVKAPAELELHPDDAGPRSLATGDRIRVWNDQGEVVVPVRVSEGTRPGVAVLPKGLWARHTQNGWTSNVLAPDTYTDLGDGATFNDTRVQIEKA